MIQHAYRDARDECNHFAIPVFGGFKALFAIKKKLAKKSRLDMYPRAYRETSCTKDRENGKGLV